MKIKKLSFIPYGNAIVKIYDDGEIILQSYNTEVIIITPTVNGRVLDITGLYSATTRKHISAFMREYGEGFDYQTAKLLFNDNMLLNLDTGEVWEK